MYPADDALGGLSGADLDPATAARPVRLGEPLHDDALHPGRAPSGVQPVLADGPVRGGRAESERRHEDTIGEEALEEGAALAVRAVKQLGAGRLQDVEEDQVGWLLGRSPRRTGAAASGSGLEGPEVQPAVVDDDEFTVEDEGPVEGERGGGEVGEGGGEVGAVSGLEVGVAGACEEQGPVAVGFLLDGEAAWEGPVGREGLPGLGQHRLHGRGEGHSPGVRVGCRGRMWAGSAPSVVYANEALCGCPPYRDLGHWSWS